MKKLEEYGNALDKVGKAQKMLKVITRGYDELNIIDPKQRFQAEVHCGGAE